MRTKNLTSSILAASIVAFSAVSSFGQSSSREQSDSFSDGMKFDRYLDVEVWTNRADGEYYEGDNIVIHFRSSRDAFVAIYSIDTRGRVNLIFPAEPEQDNFIRGGVTYSLPGDNDNFDLSVTGPEGSEYFQIIASRERFPIPNWYRNSGLVADAEDIGEYMDYLNSRHFIRYGGQRFAFDRAVIFVNEWEDYYYRPVYRNYYPSWALTGNVYIDYPYGGSVYINGIYYGVAPLYIPHLLVGWHHITIYDHYGYGWEAPFHCSYYNTAIFNHHVIHTTSAFVSKYKKVRSSGYRDPVKNGYPNYKTKKIRTVTSSSGSTNGVSTGKKTRHSSIAVDSPAKRYARGSSEMVKSGRGWETSGVTGTYNKRSRADSREGRLTAKTDNDRRTGSVDRRRSRADSREGRLTAKRGNDRSSRSVERRRSRTTSNRNSMLNGDRSRGGERTSVLKSGKSRRSSGYYKRSSGKSSTVKSGKRGTVKRRSTQTGTSTSTGKVKSGSSGTSKSSGKVGRNSSGKTKSSSGSTRSKPGGKRSKSDRSGKRK